MAVKRFFYEIVPVLCVSSCASLDLGVFSDGTVLLFYFYSEVVDCRGVILLPNF
mgnify:CR=1 FL=1